MTKLEPCQSVSCVVFVRPTGNSQRHKEENTASVIGSKKVAKQHEEGVKSNSLDDFYPAGKVDIAVWETNRDKR